MQNHKKYKIAFILVAIIIILLSFTLFLYIKTPIFFKPKNKVIQYQEEVKLSDGSMIWVDIKRHYWLSGGALGDAGMFTGNYMPGIVEISWDTGFEGVGRQSVFFYNGVIFIDKIDNVWYVLGGHPSYNGAYNGIDAINCRDVGIPINNNLTCVYILGNATIPKQSLGVEKFVQSIMVNILTLDGLYEWEHNSGKLENSRLSWAEKTDLNASISNIQKQSLGKPYAQY